MKNLNYSSFSSQLIGERSVEPNCLHPRKTKLKKLVKSKIVEGFFKIVTRKIEALCLN